MYANFVSRGAGWGAKQAFNDTKDQKQWMAAHNTVPEVPF